MKITITTGHQKVDSQKLINLVSNKKVVPKTIAKSSKKCGGCRRGKSS